MIEESIAALRAGQSIILPTDTVYGLCADAENEQAVQALYRLKGRPPSWPTALLAADLELLFTYVPELHGRSEAIVRALLPGSVTLVLPNPARRFPWLTGTNDRTLGVRVPGLAPPAAAILARSGCLAATSANRPGEPDPRRVDEIPSEFLAACAVVVSGGELPGTPSTVLDFTGAEPRIVREGAVASGPLLERACAALG